MRVTSDRISDEKGDVLGRKEFAAEISKALILYSKRNTEGITVSITGEWGSGKSSLLQYLKNELKESEHKDFIKVIEFNPWIFYKEGNIKEAFMIHFALALKDFETTRTDIAKKIKNFVSGFRFLKNVNTIAGNVQEGAEKLLEYFADNGSIVEIKEEIDKALYSSDKKIFILIDDVDRLAQAEILELLQVVSLVMNFSNVYYIIAFDKGIVTNAINKECGNRGADYLEKIIQVDYSVPSIRKEKFETLFFEMLVQMTEDYGITFEKSTIKSLWGYHGLSEYFTTVRDLKRFFNSLSFRLPSIANDINVTDFIAIEAIRLFDNEGYNLFYSTYMSNLRKRDVPESIFKEDQLKQFIQTTSDIIKALFPKSTIDATRTNTNQKRIYDSDYFERYFSLLRNDGDVSEKEFNNFMQKPDQRNIILTDLAKQDKTRNLLKRLKDDRIGKHFPEYDYGVVDAIIKYFSSHCTEFEKFDYMVCDAIISLVSSPRKAENYISKFFLSFKDQDATLNIIYIYFFHYIRILKKENRSFDNKHYEFNSYYKENYDEIYSGYIDTFKNAAPSMLEKRYTLDCPYVKYLYVINYAELFPTDYLNYYKELIKDKDFLFYVIRQFVKMGESFSDFRYDLQFKDLIFPNSTFMEMQNFMKNLDTSTIEERQRIYINHFVRIGVNE